MRRLLLCLLLAFAASDRVSAAPLTPLERDILTKLAWTETFEDAADVFDRDVDLGVHSEWTTSLANGALVYENTTSSTAIHYFGFGQLRFAGGALSNADGAEISALVKVEEATGGAAGLLAGSGRTGDYMVFAIGAGDQFQVFEKKDGRVTLIETGNNTAIQGNTFNTLRLTQDDGTLTFLVNDKPVFEAQRSTLAEAPVGVAVAGKGRFAFDDVGIVPGRRMLTSYRKLCHLPPAGTNNVVVLVGAHEGAATSNVTIAGQDEVTQLIDVHVTAGDGPLYVMAMSADTTIWRITGATERISRFAAIAGPRPAAVAGLPEDRVTVVHEPCLNRLDGKTWAPAFVAASLSVGKVVNVTASEYAVTRVDLPEGTMVTGQDATSTHGLPEQADIELLKEALRFTPAGIATLSVEEVVGAPAEIYEVLPREWGMIDLINQGKLERVPAERGENLFRVLGPMRFPPEPNGDRLTFLVPEGLPMPTGKRRRSKVIQERAGDAIGEQLRD
ncbi:MAG: hypothetical protein ABIO40_11020 [Devosia sp.]